MLGVNWNGNGLSKNPCEALFGTARERERDSEMRKVMQEGATRLVFFFPTKKICKLKKSFYLCFHLFNTYSLGSSDIPGTMLGA